MERSEPEPTESYDATWNDSKVAKFGKYARASWEELAYHAITRDRLHADRMARYRQRLKAAQAQG